MTTNARAVAVLMALLALPAAAQAQSPDARPSVDVATIKRAAPNAIRNRVMPTAPNRLYIPSMSLVWLIYTAYAGRRPGRRAARSRGRDDVLGRRGAVACPSRARSWADSRSITTV